MKMFVIEDNSVAKVFDDFPKDEYFNNRNDIRQFSSVEAQDFLKDNGYETSEKLQAIFFADGCDCCKDYFTIPGWGWVSEDAKSLTQSAFNYFENIIHAYDNNIKVTEWCPGTTIDGDTLNFCEDCYTRYDDKQLGIIDEHTGMQRIFKDIKNNVFDGLSSLNKNFILDEKTIENISLAIKEILLDKVAYDLSPYTFDDISELTLDNKDILNIASKVYATNDSLSVNEEHAIYLIIEDAFKNNGISIEPLGEKITREDNSFRKAGIIEEPVYKLYTSVTKDISNGLLPIIHDLPHFSNDTIKYLNLSIKDYFLNNVSRDDADFIKDSSTILTSDEINSFIEKVLNCNESNTNIPYETEKAISNIITNAFKDNGFTVDFDFDKSKNNELMSFADYKHLVYAIANIYQDHIPYEQTTRALNSVLHETPDYKLTHSKDGLVLSSKHNSSSKKLSVAEFADLNKNQFENFVKDFIQTSKDSSKVTFDTKKLISSSINNTINLLKSQGVSLPEIGKALNEATKEQLVLLGKENMASKGR